MLALSNLIKKCTYTNTEKGMPALTQSAERIIVQNDNILHMIPGNRSKTFWNWSKARLSSLIQKQTIQSNDTSMEGKNEIKTTFICCSSKKFAFRQK